MKYVAMRAGKDNGRNAVINQLSGGEFQVDFTGANGSVIPQKPEVCESKADAIEAAEDFCAGSMTNVEKVVMLMEWGSPVGALIQPFVMVAIEKYAEQVIAAGAAKVDSPMIAGEAWVAAAEYAKSKVS